jgi:hypothetical protein
MKPHLPPAPATDEDSHIWWVQHWRQPFKPLQLMTISIASDRRDAELMLTCQMTWREGFRFSRPDCPYRGKLAVSRGDQVVECGGDITRFAR